MGDTAGSAEQDAEETGSGNGEEPSSPGQKLLAIVFLAAVAVGLFFFWRYIEPNSVHEAKNPTWLDSIFANPAVVGGARIVLLSLAIVLLFGSIYAAASSVVRMQRRQWLRRAGPFESHLEEAKEELDEIDPFLELYATSIEENEQLASRLSERDGQYEELATAYGAAIELLRENELIE